MLSNLAGIERARINKYPKAGHGSTIIEEGVSPCDLVQVVTWYLGI